MKFNFSIPESARDIFNEEANNFVSDLHIKFGRKIKDLIELRASKQKKYNSGELPNFLAETQSIRDSEWQVREIPHDLLDRRVEITGPVDRKMIINALNADVKVFMADFEDSLSPTWENVAQGQVNMRDAVNRSISFENKETGKK